VLTAPALLLLLAGARAEQPEGVELIEPDPAWPRVTVSGTLDRPESLVGSPLRVAASPDKAGPFHDRYLAVCELGSDDSFELSLAAPPGGVHLWVLIEGRTGAWEQGFHQLYNHYPLEIPAAGLHGVHFTMADYRLTFEGVDPGEAVEAPWWWLFGAAGLALLGLLVLRRLQPGGRAQRLPALPALPALPREGRWIAALLLLAALLRLPSLSESLSMTEFVHAQIAARGGGIEGGFAPVAILDVPTCMDLCASVQGAELPGCEPACIQHFHEDIVPPSVAACALGDRGATTPHQLLACLARWGNP
jgi:hypothetical protein